MLRGKSERLRLATMAETVSSPSLLGLLTGVLTLSLLNSLFGNFDFEPLRLFEDNIQDEG